MIVIPAATLAIAYSACSKPGGHLAATLPRNHILVLELLSTQSRNAHMQASQQVSQQAS